MGGWRWEVGTGTRGRVQPSTSHRRPGWSPTANRPGLFGAAKDNRPAPATRACYPRRAAAVVYFTIFFAVLFGFWVALHFGWRPSSAAGTAGTLAAAYVATKLTQPLRIAATLALTPLAARLYHRAARRRV